MSRRKKLSREELVARRLKEIDGDGGNGTHSLLWHAAELRVISKQAAERPDRIAAEYKLVRRDFESWFRNQVEVESESASDSD
jgi:hypothetical protein